MRLEEMLSGIEGFWVRRPKSMEIVGADCDSRRVGPGYIFVAYKGDVLDGHSYISEAVRRGAIVVVAERPVAVPDGVGLYIVEDGRVAAAKIAAALHKHPQKSLSLIAVTGTAGKTTTTLLIRHILNRCSIPTAALTTIAYYTSPNPHPSINTTPGPFLLHSLLAESWANGYRFCVMEVSSHAICQKRVYGLDFASAVLTNIGSDHLDYHGTHAAYRAAKRRLFHRLNSNAVAVLNADDRFFHEFLTAHNGVKITYGLREGGLRGRVISAGLNGMTLEIEFGGDVVFGSVPLVGLHNVYNVLGAVGAALSVGVGLFESLKALESFPGVPGRLEIIKGVSPTVLVDYAHTEEALKSALLAVKPFVSGRLILVFGCGGDRDRLKRPRMGMVAEAFADIVVLTSDNPRSEKPEAIIAEILDGMRRPEKVVVEVDRRAAIERAISIARPNDVVLVAGKGHETVQIIGNRPIPFDDREIVRETVERMAKSKAGRSVA